MAKKAKLSDNEKKAAKAGMSVKSYNAAKKKDSSKSSSSKDSKDEKKAKKKITSYYKEEKKLTEGEAATKTARFQQDMTNLLKDAGIAQTRATEDYIRNIGNIQANKAADVNDLNYYVQNKTGRTTEDLNTALAKETRRYSLEYDQINQDLADRGMTFSERKPETIAQAGTAQNTADIQTEANRSFQDIQRYEAVQNRDIELKYGQQTASTETTKTRTLEDILNEQQQKSLDIQRGKEDVAFGKTKDIRDLSYDSDTGVAQLGQQFDQYALDKEIRDNQNKVG